mgnify:CR=1 FL=1
MDNNGLEDGYLSWGTDFDSIIVAFSNLSKVIVALYILVLFHFQEYVAMRSDFCSAYEETYPEVVKIV